MHKIFWTAKKSSRRILIGFLLLLVIGALRLPWVEADGGNRWMAAFGFFATDEGEYTTGGRSAYLTGSFLDAELLSPSTFATSPGMHFLAYLSYCVCGLDFMAARLPTILIAVIGWFSAYWITSRYTPPLIAGITSFVISCNPMSLTYERVASTDVVVGGMSILSACLANRRSTFLTAISGIILGLAFSVKLTALLLLPLIFLLLAARSHCLLKRLLSFTIPLVCTLGVFYWFKNHSYYSDIENVIPKDSVWGLVNWDWIRAISNFPRWPMSAQMGLLLIVILILSTWTLLHAFYHKQRLLTSKNALSLGILIFIGAFATQAFNCTRYFLPLVYFLPLLFVRSRSSVVKTRYSSFQIFGFLFFVFAGLIFIYWFVLLNISGADLNDYLSTEAFFSKKILWGLFWPKIVFSFCFLLIAIKFFWRTSWSIRQWVVMIGSILLVLELIFSNYNRSYQDLAGTTHQRVALSSLAFVQDQVTLQVAIAIISFLLVSKSRFYRWQRWYVGFALLFIAFSFFNAHWYYTYKDLPLRRYHVRDTARQLATTLPPHSIIIGGRASSLMRESPFRIGLCNINYREGFMQKVDELLRNHPKDPIFWITESDWDPILSDYRDYRKKGVERFEIQEIANYQLPSVANLALRSVFVWQVTRKDSEFKR